MKTIFLLPPPALPVPAVRGGAVEGLLTHLIEENERQGRVRLICVSIPDPEAMERARHYRHTVIHYLPHRENRGLWGPMCGLLRRMGRPAPLDPWYNQVLRLIRREQPDLVVAEGGDLNEPQAIAACVGRGKMWAHLHMQIAASPLTDSMYGGVLAISQYVADRWMGSDVTTALVPNCVDPARFCPGPELERQALRARLGLAPEDFVVLFCGRICPEKGPHKLVEALRHIPDPHVKLVIAGSPFFDSRHQSPFFDQLQRDAEPLGDRVLFTGFVPNDQMPDYYRAADAACFPALWDEPAGITAIEAMACGCPVIATESGGMTEYLQGSGAILLPRDEIWDFGFTPIPGARSLAKGLADAILALKQDPARRQAMRRAGIERAAAFSRAAYYDKMLRALIGPENEVN